MKSEHLLTCLAAATLLSIPTVSASIAMPSAGNSIFVEAEDFDSSFSVTTTSDGFSSGSYIDGFQIEEGGVTFNLTSFDPSQEYTITLYYRCGLTPPSTTVLSSTTDATPASGTYGTVNTTALTTTGWGGNPFATVTTAGFTLASGTTAIRFTGIDEVGTQAGHLKGAFHFDRFEISATGATDYDTWAGDYPGLGAAGDDDDGDGLTNDKERIFGLNPTSGASVNPYAVPMAADGTFSYTRRTQSLTGLTYKVCYSTNLEQWFEDPVGNASQTPGTPAADVEIVGVTIDPALLTEPRLFIKVSAEDLGPPPPAPEVSSLWGSGSKITLNFSEAMNEPPATATANYTVELDGGATVPVTGASLSGDGKTVILTLGSSLAIDSAYNVIMSNLTGSGGEPLAGSGTAQFLTWDDDPAGVKVFILAGQSNMVGYGKTEVGGNPAWTPENGEPKEITGGIGCLRYLAKNDASYPVYDFTSLLVDPGDLDSAWRIRSDVKVWWHNGASGFLGGPLQKGDLGPPFQGAGSSWLGPEFAFGQVLGDHYGSNDVLIIKTAWGGRSLAVDFRPPSAVADRGGAVGPYYEAIFDEVREVLDNLHTEFPEWGPGGANLGYQIVGFGWHQGFNDRVGGAAISGEYKDNLPDLISDVRAEFGKPDLPFVIASTGMAPSGPAEDPPYSGYSDVEKAQLWEAGIAKPANVLSDDTRHYWREAALAVSTQGHHWNHSAESYFLIGKKMGDNMVTLLGEDPE